ncbi:MAG: hypothetical protein ABIF77_10195 [bacterium]
MGSNRTNYSRGSALTSAPESEAETLVQLNKKYGLALELDAVSNPFSLKRLEKNAQPLEPMSWPHGYEPADEGDRLDPVVLVDGRHHVPLIPVRLWHLRNCGPTHALTVAFQNYWFARSHIVSDPAYEFTTNELRAELQQVDHTIQFLEQYDQGPTVNYYRRQTTEHERTISGEAVDVQKHVATIMDPDVQERLGDTLNALDTVIRELMHYAISLRRSLETVEGRTGPPEKYFRRTGLLEELLGTPVIDLWEADITDLSSHLDDIDLPDENSDFLEFCLKLRSNRPPRRGAFLTQKDVAALLLASGVEKRKVDESLESAIERVLENPVKDRWSNNIAANYRPDSA